MRDKLKAAVHSVWFGIGLNIFAAAINMAAAVAFPGPIDWLNWTLFGIGMATAYWLWMLSISRKDHQEIYEMQRKFIDELLEKLQQPRQVSAQEFKSSIQKFMEDQDDKPVNPNGPKVH